MVEISSEKEIFSKLIFYNNFHYIFKARRLGGFISHFFFKFSIIFLCSNFSYFVLYYSFNREEDGGGGSGTMENEKRMRREIANSNERRRMQSINAGFQSLRTLLPHHEGEKLSKVSVVFSRLSSTY